ncbi:hypothetical protein [Salinibacter ruber]|uniref:hypothetical protein n=1 Tax=Salinibacter ruber TaxID=146919 RepID=UPI0021690DCB|nr:hypothetical protein [Salinibacter ruber]MCS3610953.1 hypothetical protein [Salinibacter ruber]
MPQVKPEHRPGSDFNAADRVALKESRPPDRTGEKWGMTWAGWRQFPEGSNRFGKIRAYITDPSGDLLMGLQMRSVRRQSKRPYHTVESWDELDQRLWRLYWTRLYDDHDPLKAEQEYIRRQTDAKAKRQSYEQWRERQRAKWRVETEHLPDRTLCRIID